MNVDDIISAIPAICTCPSETSVVRGDHSSACTGLSEHTHKPHQEMCPRALARKVRERCKILSHDHAPEDCDGACDWHLLLEARHLIEAHQAHAKALEKEYAQLCRWVQMAAWKFGIPNHPGWAPSNFEHALRQMAGFAPVKTPTTNPGETHET